MADLHVVREHTVRDIPAVLRVWADAIEAGRHGNVSGCVLVLDADDFAVAFAGTAPQPGANTVLLLATAQAKIINGTLALIEAREET